MRSNRGVGSNRAEEIKEQEGVPSAPSVPAPGAPPQAMSMDSLPVTPNCFSDPKDLDQNQEGSSLQTEGRPKAFGRGQRTPSPVDNSTFAPLIPPEKETGGCPTSAEELRDAVAQKFRTLVSCVKGLSFFNKSSSEEKHEHRDERASRNRNNPR